MRKLNLEKEKRLVNNSFFPSFIALLVRLQQDKAHLHPEITQRNAHSIYVKPNELL